MTITTKDDPTSQQFLGLRRTAIALGLTRREVSAGRVVLERTLGAIKSGGYVKIIPPLTRPSWASQIVQVSVGWLGFVLVALSKSGAAELDRSTGAAGAWQDQFDLRTTTHDDLLVVLKKGCPTLLNKQCGSEYVFIGTETKVLHSFLHWPTVTSLKNGNLIQEFASIADLHSPGPQQWYVFRL